MNQHYKFTLKCVQHQPEMSITSNRTHEVPCLHLNLHFVFTSRLAKRTNWPGVKAWQAKIDICIDCLCPTEHKSFEFDSSFGLFFCQISFCFSRVVCVSCMKIISIVRNKVINTILSYYLHVMVSFGHVNTSSRDCAESTKLCLSIFPICSHLRLSPLISNITFMLFFYLFCHNSCKLYALL